MSLKTIKGKLYYYRSKREGDRVRSEYVGGGSGGLLFAVMDEKERESRFAEQAELNQAKSEDQEIQDWFDCIERLAGAALLLSGYHRHHRGPWRRRRNDDDSSEV